MAVDTVDSEHTLDVPTMADDSNPASPQPTSATNSKDIDEVLHSDIGLSILLERLKQSIASARDFAAFLKKRSSIEEEHAKDLKRLAKTTQDNLHRGESRQGTYAHQVESAMRVHERMADNGMQFALSLHQMHEDLNELSNNMERGRKNWKHEGLDAEKRASDAESMMQKAKSRYDNLAEDYDRAKTGDIKGSRRIMKGTKSSAQHEEDLARKVQTADSDYSTKVQSAKTQREQLINVDRPKAIKNLQELIQECDSALTLQLQKFATFNEKLLLGNGILITPLPSEGNQQGSLRDIMNGIDNEKDLHSQIVGHRSKVPPQAAEIRYEQHPTLLPKQQMPIASTTSRQPSSSGPPVMSSSALPPPVLPKDDQLMQPTPPTSQPTGPSSPYSPGAPQPQSSYGPSVNTSSPGYAPYSQQQQSQRPYPADDQRQLQAHQPPPQQQQPQHQQQRSQPPYPVSPNPGSMRMPPQQSQSNGEYQSTGPSAVQPPISMQQPTNGMQQTRNSNLPPPTRPVFGLDLEELFLRDNTAVPMVVYQCMQAIDLFGLEVEGIYRLSGTATHVQQLKALFDHDASRVDFRNPATFHHDVNSVAGLLKQFFRDLPDPLFTRERYAEFISAARIDDETVRRDTLHAAINGLPDANYATMRALVLHLNRVQEHSGANRMSASNLAICLAPSLMGSHTGPQIADAGLQARVLDTILVNTYQIFDED